MVKLHQEIMINGPNNYDGSIRVHINGRETLFKDVEEFSCEEMKITENTLEIFN